MNFTRKEIFWKCWIWSMAIGILLATVFWIASSIIGFFNQEIGAAAFLYLLFGFSIIGSYIGAGFVGWRITDKYHHHFVKQFIKRYEAYSLASLIILAGIILSPMPYLGLLWSVLAPFCVLAALSKLSSLLPKKA